MLEFYYEKFFIQSQISYTDLFGDVHWRWADGADIQGIFIQNSSNEMIVAEAQGFTSIGTFATNINVPIEENDIVRRDSDGTYYRIKGVPVKSPEQAESQFLRANAERTEKPQ